MTESTLSLTFANLYAEVSNYLGLGLSPADANLTLAKKYVNDGYRRALIGLDPRTQRQYRWSFLAPATSIALWPDVAVDADVTVTASGDPSTTITATEASFYPSMVGRTITITAVGDRTISGYTSTTVITVSAATTAAAKTFSIASGGYFGLPDDFGAMLDNPRYGTDDAAVSIIARSYAYVRDQYTASGATTGMPNMYAVVPRAFTTATGQRHDLLVWPTPGSLYTVYYRHQINPAALSAATDYPVGGLMFGDVVLKAALAEAELRHNDRKGPMDAAFQEAMAGAIDADCRNQPTTPGQMEDYSDGWGYSYDRRLSVTYNT